MKEKIINWKVEEEEGEKEGGEEESIEVNLHCVERDQKGSTDFCKTLEAPRF